MADSIPATLHERLHDLAFSTSQARDAIRGLAVPDALGRRVMRLCIIRGIRHHEDFARAPQTQALRPWPEFARALNARAIMSNSIPDMALDPVVDDVPYCIWYPDTATEDTYRQLVRRYPQMTYQTARACAVAGFSALYRELEEAGSILPDISIAEEARACGSQDIYNAIMSQPVRYRVMDDYTRSILQNPLPSGLNGDAAVQPMLRVKQKFTTPRGHEDCLLLASEIGDGADSDEEFDDDLFSMFPEPGFEEAMFNITEDMNIDEFATPEPDGSADVTMAEYLAKPLPLDLPAGNKDILILAAAYSGDVDRYARLRRPKMIDNEAGCVVRGIYHSSFFATWWASSQGLPPPKRPPHRHALWITQAIHARMIMSNDLSRLTPDTPRDQLPYLIWYPAVASPRTYEEVARRCPAMRAPVLRAAIYSRNRDLFDSLVDAVEPDPFLLAEAREHDDFDDDVVDDDGSRESYFTRRLLARAEQLGLAEEIRNVQHDRWGVLSWKRFSVRTPPASGNWLFSGPGIVGAAQDPGIYNEVWADASAAELFASAPEAWRPREGGVQIDYNEFPQ
ncbi:hypothetical protein IF1G_10753 [Cordyceps javanica]|uniref:Uncharacterized protein n=1 Tax=Cordyceps javanica TaxID=43265 RepID=A0A545VJY1_9HYPO|nr:hypothetical protein IF1G_10753 [Cordyceps javanica]TQW02048.1 hypothetical protein IF2G_10448 [Cordyceps javanica]